MEVGTTVWCHWSSDDVHVFDGENAHHVAQPDRLALTEPA
jgi:hypothetical protein